MRTLTDNFEDITAGFADVGALGDQIIEENQQLPFGAELLTETSAAASLGSLACIHNTSSTADDSVIIGTTGCDNNVGIPAFDEMPQDISALN